MNILLWTCVALFAGSLAVRFIFFRKPHTIKLVGTIVEMSIGHASGGYSFVTIKDHGTGEDTELIFDTCISESCEDDRHENDGECFHGKADELNKLLRHGDQITVLTRDKKGNRNVYELVEVIEINTSD